jgi:general L-amino acid transport system permease protein
MTDVPADRGWVRTAEAPLLPPPRNTSGVVGWIMANMFPSLGSGILTILGLLLAGWFAWDLLKWAVIDATFVGENRDACVAGQAEGRTLGACWPFVWAKFHQWIYGFYPFDERWRVNICFVVGAAALIPMLMPSMPYKKWNAIFLLAVYPLMTFILLTGGNVDLSTRFFIALQAFALLTALALPLAIHGAEAGIKQNVVGIGLAAAGVLCWLLSFFLTEPQLPLGTPPFSFFGFLAYLLMCLAGLFSLFLAFRAGDPTARSVVIVWALVWLAIEAALVLVSIDLGLEPVETSQWGGLLVTLVVAATGIVFSLPLGVLLALGRRSTMPIVRLFSIVFIEVWRGVPLITVLFMASFMLPLFMPEGVNFDKLLRALVGVSLFSAAYMAETVRGGLQAIPKGQYEAAQALGLSYWRMMGLIILPQALKIVIPGIVNNFIGLFKDTTLVAIVSLFDLLGIVNSGMQDAKWASPQTAPTGYFVAATIFWIFCFGMSRYSIFMERRLATGHKR